MSPLSKTQGRAIAATIPVVTARSQYEPMYGLSSASSQIILAQAPPVAATPTARRASFPARVRGAAGLRQAIPRLDGMECIMVRLPLSYQALAPPANSRRE